MDEMNNNVVETTGADENQEQKTFTYEEVMALVQSESDKRTNQALAKERKKHEKELSLSKLDGSEREKAEKDNMIAELREQLAAFQTEKNKSELKSVLSARGLSAEFADIVSIGDDIEEAQANIDKLDKLFKAAVKAEVEKRLAQAGGAPKGNGTGAGTAKKSIKEMSLAEMANLSEEEFAALK